MPGTNARTPWTIPQRFTRDDPLAGPRPASPTAWPRAGMTPALLQTMSAPPNVAIDLVSQAFASCSGVARRSERRSTRTSRSASSDARRRVRLPRCRRAPRVHPARSARLSDREPDSRCALRSPRRSCRRCPLGPPCAYSSPAVRRRTGYVEWTLHNDAINAPVSTHLPRPAGGRWRWPCRTAWLSSSTMSFRDGGFFP